MLKESQHVQLEYKSAVKEKLARQAKIYDNTLSQDELEDIINDPEVISVVCLCLETLFSLIFKKILML